MILKEKKKIMVQCCFSLLLFIIINLRSNEALYPYSFSKKKKKLRKLPEPYPDEEKAKDN